MNRFTYLADVVTLELAPEKCVGCGLCAIVCPHAVLQMNGSRAAIIRRDDCMECGACAMNCPTGAIAVDAGVGCAAGIINAALGRTGADCCCVIEPRTNGDSQSPEKSKGIGCC